MTSASKRLPSLDVSSNTQYDKQQWQWRRLGLEKIVLWIVLGIGAIAMIGPFYWMFISSFKNRQEGVAISPDLVPQTFTLEHWAGLSALPVGSMTIFFRNSLFVVTVVTSITLLTSSLAGYVFAKFESASKT